jgi:hypothetical protein
MHEDHGLLVLAMGIACVIVLAGWTVMAVLLGVFMSRRVRKLEAAAPGPYPREDIALLYYGISALFSPAALAFAIIFLREARTARQGRICGIIGLGHVSLIVLLTCVGMFLLALFAPGWLPA